MSTAPFLSWILSEFLQQLKLGSDKVSLKENEFRSKQREVEEIQGVIRSLQAKRNDQLAVSVGLDGVNATIPKEELHFILSQRRNGLEQYITSKRTLSALEKEVSVLKNSEEILRSRLAALDVQLKNQEINSGVRGYRETQANLEQASEETAQLDEIKGRTLEEITGIIQTIVEELEEKKAAIKPKVRQLVERFESDVLHS